MDRSPGTEPAAPPDAAPPRREAAWLPPSAALARFQHPVGTAGAGQRARPEAVRYGFRVGALGLLIKPRTGSEVIKLTPPAALPNRPEWLLGVHVAAGYSPDGEVWPEFDHEGLCRALVEPSTA